MASGLLALLDDVAALVKASAASLDDISVQVAKTGAKVSGVVIDDAAVTPKYVVGLDPKRELSIIYNIAKRSLVNKLAILAPAAMLLGYLAPWAITPILMCGGAYLCFEGYEKLHAMFSHDKHGNDEDTATIITPEQLEKARIKSAVQTDMILSAEIIAITYAMVAEESILNQIAVLAIIAIGITVAVYGFVGLLVKMDDIGLYFAKKGRSAAVRAMGRGIVKGMPGTLKVIGYIGTAAMLWVGAEIIAHGVPPIHHALEHLQETIPGSLGWLAKAALCAVGGLVLGALVAKAIALIAKLRGKSATH
ncbi:MAG: DUF808 domain-containing protein [Rickettsiales bacterium]